MIAIEIRVNGALHGTCGTEDAKQMVAMLSARQSKDGPDFRYVLECMGLRMKETGKEEALKWPSARVSIGDEVTLKIVDTDKAQPPIDRQEISPDFRADDKS